MCLSVYMTTDRTSTSHEPQKRILCDRMERANRQHLIINRVREAKAMNASQYRARKNGKLNTAARLSVDQTIMDAELQVRHGTPVDSKKSLDRTILS